MDGQKGEQKAHVLRSKDFGTPFSQLQSPSMRTDTTEKILEKLATSDKATIVIERQPDGKMRVTSGPYVIFRDQLLKASDGDGRLHVPRKPDDGTRRSSATTRMAQARA